MRLTNTVFLIALVPMVLTAGVLGLLLNQLDSAEHNRLQEERARKAMDDVLTIEHALAHSGVFMIKYTDGLDPKWVEQFEFIKSELPRILQQLDAVCVSPESRAIAHDLAKHVAICIASCEEIIWSAPLEGADLCPVRINELRSGLEPKIAQMTGLELKLRDQLAKEIALSPDNSVSLRQTARSYVLFGLLGTVLGSLVMVGILSRRINRRLAVISDNSKRLPQKLPLRAPLSGADEIAQLDKTFHQMAAALDAARKREQDAVENSADVIAALDHSSNIAKVSAAVSGWGFDAEALVGKPVSALIPASESQLVSERLNRITQGDTAIQFESKVQTATGEMIDVLWSAQTSELDGLLFCVVHDITERKRMERLLQESAEREKLLNEKASEIHAEVLRDREERKALAELKQRLLAMIAGEIEAPLSALNQALEKFRAGEFGELSANGRQKIEAGESEGKRLVRLFHDLIKTEAGAHQDLKLNFEPTNLQDVIAQAAGAVQLQAEKAGVTIVVDAPSCERSVDSDRLVQVLVNLLSNAIKFANSGDTITLRLREREPGVEIRVSDQGRGIPEGMLDRVFDAFVQVEDSDASVKGGSGLGLAICRSIIERHGGKIWAEKNVGPGCTFVINFSS